MHKVVDVLELALATRQLLELLDQVADVQPARQLDGLGHVLARHPVVVVLPVASHKHLLRLFWRHALGRIVEGAWQFIAVAQACLEVVVVVVPVLLPVAHVGLEDRLEILAESARLLQVLLPDIRLLRGTLELVDLVARWLVRIDARGLLKYRQGFAVADPETTQHTGGRVLRQRRGRRAEPHALVIRLTGNDVVLVHVQLTEVLSVLDAVQVATERELGELARRVRELLVQRVQKVDVGAWIHLHRLDIRAARGACIRVRPQVGARVHVLLPVREQVVGSALLVALDVQELGQIRMHALVLHGARLLVKRHVRVRHGAVRVRAVGGRVARLALVSHHGRIVSGLVDHSRVLEIRVQRVHGIGPHARERQAQAP